MGSRWRRTTLVVLLALVAAACGGYGGDGGGDGGDGDGVATLLGEDATWELVEGVVDDVAVPRLADGRITLTRTPDGAGGTAACNQYFAALVVDGKRVTFEAIGQTEMGCEPPLMEAEQRYLTGLARVDAGERLGDRLTLTGDGVRFVFARQAPVSTADLVGTVWLLDGLIDGDAVSSVSTDITDPELILEVGGALWATTGCRTLRGRWEAAGDEIVVPELAAEGECPPELQRMDAHVIDVIGDRFRPEVDGQRLRLRSSGGLGLAYRVQDAVDG